MKLFIFIFKSNDFYLSYLFWVWCTSFQYFDLLVNIWRVQPTWSVISFASSFPLTEVTKLLNYIVSTHLCNDTFNFKLYLHKNNKIWFFFHTKNDNLFFTLAYITLLLPIGNQVKKQLEVLQHHCVSLEVHSLLVDVCTYILYGNPIKLR